MEIRGILTCFSLVRNTKAFLNTSTPDGAITSICGIRVISMFWVILGHFMLFSFIVLNHGKCEQHVVLK